MNKIDKMLKETIFLDGYNFNNVYVEVLNEVKEYTQKVNNLFEKKGVAMYDFKTEIGSLIDYIEEIFNANFQNNILERGTITIDGVRIECFRDKNEIGFQIPKKLTKQINFIKNLNIIVKIVNYWDDESNNLIKLESLVNGSSQMKDLYDLTFLKKKLKNGFIECNLISINGKLNRQTISGVLYHELGHYFQEFQLQKKGDNLVKMSNRKKFYNDNQLSTSNNIYVQKIWYLTYILLDKMELSQHASEIYAELIEMKPQIRNINNAIVNTKTYETYLKLQNYIEELNKYKYVDIWEATKHCYKTKSNSKELNITTGWSFKERFIKECIKRLKIFYRKMIAAAELYIQEINQGK